LAQWYNLDKTKGLGFAYDEHLLLLDSLSLPSAVTRQFYCLLTDIWGLSFILFIFPLLGFETSYGRDICLLFSFSLFQEGDGKTRGADLGGLRETQYSLFRVRRCLSRRRYTRILYSSGVAYYGQDYHIELNKPRIIHPKTHSTFI